MFGEVNAFSGCSSNDIDGCRRFYADTLGLKVTEANGLLTLHLGGGGTHIIYPKASHQPATYTVLNFPVPDIDRAVDDLAAAGVRMTRYEGFHQDDRGIARPERPEDGPAIAWFTDPAGNILSVIQS